MNIMFETCENTCVNSTVKKNSNYNMFETNEYKQSNHYNQIDFDCLTNKKRKNDDIQEECKSKIKLLKKSKNKYSNKYLYEKIAENGAIITEFPLGTYPDPENFPRRNRIITGLSVATLIVESRLNGGAMISANFAFDQNREVYAIPGNINSEMSKGPNYLIQNNKAKLVTCAEDIISDLGLKIKPKVKDISQFNLGMFELSIYENLSNEPIHIDEIATKVNISVSDCLVSLLNLEFEGLIKQLPGKYFIKV